jgi:hypothetical protein
MKIGEIWIAKNSGEPVRITKIKYYPPCDIVPYSWDCISYEWVNKVFSHSCGTEEFMLCFEKDWSYESR